MYLKLSVSVIVPVFVNKSASFNNRNIRICCGGAHKFTLKFSYFRVINPPIFNWKTGTAQARPTAPAVPPLGTIIQSHLYYIESVIN